MKQKIVFNVVLVGTIALAIWIGAIIGGAIVYEKCAFYAFPDIMDVQKELVKRGHDVKIDGIGGPYTDLAMVNEALTEK